jgi:hypothetical protein
MFGKVTVALAALGPAVTLRAVGVMVRVGLVASVQDRPGRPQGEG